MLKKEYSCRFFSKERVKPIYVFLMDGTIYVTMSHEHDIKIQIIKVKI